LRRFEVTSVYVTHDQIEAIALADRLAVMRWGRIEQVGSYWDVYTRPINRFVGSFVGSPPMNFLPAHIHSESIEIAGVPRHIARPGDRYLPVLPVTLGIRPEDIQLAAGDPAAIWIDAETVEYLPSDRAYFVYTNIGNTRITAKIKTETRIQRNERVPVRLVLEHASYFDPTTGERVA
jgi:ABC-type sugar transport system ATPase subunit